MLEGDIFLAHNPQTIQVQISLIGPPIYAIFSTNMGPKSTVRVHLEYTFGTVKVHF